MEYLWVGQYSQKNYHMIWGILAMHKNGFDGLNGADNYTYVSFEGRSDKPMRLKSFQENEKNMTGIIKHKQDRGYVLMSGGRFTELYPAHNDQIQNHVVQLLRNKQ
jgi:hypothetical protein